MYVKHTLSGPRREAAISTLLETLGLPCDVLVGAWTREELAVMSSFLRQSLMCDAGSRLNIGDTITLNEISLMLIFQNGCRAQQPHFIACLNPPLTLKISRIKSPALSPG